VSDLLQLATEGKLTLTLRLFSEMFATPGNILLPLLHGSKDLTFEDVLEMDLPMPCRADYVSAEKFEELMDRCQLIGTEEVPILFCPWDEDYPLEEEENTFLVDAGTYWRVSLHGLARDVLQKWWRESYSDEEKDWNSIKPKKFLENLGSIELWGYEYILAGHDPTFFLTCYPDIGVNYFMRVKGSELPETTMIGVLADDLDELLTLEVSEAPTLSQTTTSDHQDYPPHLEALILAWRKNWKNADRHDRSTHPKKDTVKSWLIEQGLSDRTADAGATIITPDWKK
jgi:hypothetical protein